MRTYQHPTNGARYRVSLNTKEHQWMVIDYVSELIASSGRITHPVKLRLQARKGLEKLGVVLDNDVRKPRPKKTK
jgi:hypothetical protein